MNVLTKRLLRDQKPPPLEWCIQQVGVDDEALARVGWVRLAAIRHHRVVGTYPRFWINVTEGGPAGVYPDDEPVIIALESLGECIWSSIWFVDPDLDWRSVEYGHKYPRMRYVHHERLGLNAA